MLKLIKVLVIRKFYMFRERYAYGVYEEFIDITPRQKLT